MSFHAEPKCVNKSNGTETSAVNFLSEITAAESEYRKESNVSKKKDVSAEIITIKITHESASTSESSVHEKTEVEKKLTSAEDCMSGVTAEESDLVSETSANEKKHNSSGDVMREVSQVSSWWTSSLKQGGKNLLYKIGEWRTFALKVIPSSVDYSSKCELSYNFFL